MATHNPCPTKEEWAQAIHAKQRLMEARENRANAETMIQEIGNVLKRYERFTDRHDKNRCACDCATARTLLLLATDALLRYEIDLEDEIEANNALLRELKAWRASLPDMTDPYA